MSERRTYLVLDIETVPDHDLWSKPETAHDQFPPAYAHRVIAIGAMWLDHDYALRRFEVFGEGKNEAGIIDDLASFVDQHRPVLITYNGRTFDLPVIALRALRHGVPLPWYYRERGLRYRYSEDSHIDLCDWLADHGATRSGSLDAIARLIGLPGKLSVDGSQIEGLHNAGSLSLIQNYCLSDVAQTALLFVRFRLLQGELDREDYRRAVRDLTAALGQDARVAELMTALDGERLLAAA